MSSLTITLLLIKNNTKMLSRRSIMQKRWKNNEKEN
jgi:DNA-binding response OmpR family regulator